MKGITMYVRPIIVFKTPFYKPSYREFYNFDSLRYFLKDFDFMRSHKRSKLSTGLPIFRLGVRFEVRFEDELYKSDVKWISAFLCGLYLRKIDSGKMFVTVPMDKTIEKSSAKVVNREYKEIPFNESMANAVINLNNFYQVWPRRPFNKTEWVRFIKSVNKIESKLRRRLGR